MKQPRHVPELFLLIVPLLPISLLFLISTPVANAAADPWVVFTPADNTLPMSANLLLNPDFEAGDPGSATNWLSYGLGYTVDETGGRSSSRGLMLVNPLETESHGAHQSITLNQTEIKPLYFSAWSRAQDVTGAQNSSYSFYLDIYYIDDTPLYGQVLTFTCGSHDWEFNEGFIIPEKPIKSIHCYCLLRNNHSGTVWFDDLSVREVDYTITRFDGRVVALPPLLAFPGTDLPLSTSNGLTIALNSEGGPIRNITLGGEQVHDSAAVGLSSFFVRDVATGSDDVHPGGEAVANGNSIIHTGDIPSLGINYFQAEYDALPDRIDISAELTAGGSENRALTLYFSLPVDADGWTWSDDIRSSETIGGVTEYSDTSWWSGLGARNNLARYPFACISRPADSLVLALPPDEPCVFRLVHNPYTNQFYAAFDLALSPMTFEPNRAAVHFSIYRTASEWGFRSAVQGYYDRYPDDYVVRVPPDNQGIWVAFSDLSPITDVEDFGIAFHELGSLSQIAFDDAHGIFSFRYVSEPWSHWMEIDDPGVDPENYSEVMAYLDELYETGTTSQQERAEATLSSGFFDDTGAYLYESTTAPWCSGAGGCAVFTLNPDPDIEDTLYPLNKAHLDWDTAEHNTYLTWPGLDGEYIDSYLSEATQLDFRESHFAAADIPLTFRTSDQRAGVPEMFATFEFCDWLTADVHDNLGKWTMANGILLDLPWGASQFDFMGRESDWFPSGVFQAPADRSLSYYRTMAGPKPYGLLMNSDFNLLTYELTERYFQVCLFYGIYPSFFSHNASELRYFDDPALYNRDRPLFVKYIPLVRRLNRAGWRPVTHATATDSDVFVERYGDLPEMYITVRNMSVDPVTVTINLDSTALGLPGWRHPGCAVRIGDDGDAGGHRIGSRGDADAAGGVDRDDRGGGSSGSGDRRMEPRGAAGVERVGVVEELFSPVIIEIEIEIEKKTPGHKKLDVYRFSIGLSRLGLKESRTHNIESDRMAVGLSCFGGRGYRVEKESAG